MRRSKAKLKKDIQDMEVSLKKITDEMAELTPEQLEHGGSHFHLSLHHHELCIAIMRDKSFLGEVI